MQINFQSSPEDVCNALCQGPTVENAVDGIILYLRYLRMHNKKSDSNTFGPELIRFKEAAANINLKTEKEALEEELNDLLAKMMASDSPPNVESRTPEELVVRYQWSARVIEIRKRLGEIFAAQYKK